MSPIVGSAEANGLHNIYFARLGQSTLLSARNIQKAGKVPWPVGNLIRASKLAISEVALCRSYEFARGVGPA